MTGPPTPSNQEGPNNGPPSLPDGWLAQWEGQSRKYYYVQRATGHSQWDVPTQPALSVPTPDPTPQQHVDPFSRPAGDGGIPTDGTAVVRDEHGNVVETDRSLLGDLAMNAIMGGKQKPQKQSGLGGLASSFLGGGSHGGHSGSGVGSGSGGGSGGGLGGLAGQLVGSFLDGGKPHKPQQQQPSQQSSSGQSGGLMGFLGGHHGSSSQGNNYGYSSSGQGSSSGGYSGQAPPASYQPPSQHSSNQLAPSGVQHSMMLQQPQVANPHAVSGVQHQQMPQSMQTSNQYGGPGAPYGQSSQPYSGAGNSYAQNYNSSQVSLTGSHASGAPPYGQQNPTSHEMYAQQYQSSGQHGHSKPPLDNQGPGSSQYNPQQVGVNPHNPSFPGPASGQYSAPAYGQHDPHQNQNQSYPPPPSSAYGQQAPSYPPPPQLQKPPAYGQYPPSQSQTSYGTPSLHNYPPPPQNTPAYGSEQQGQGGYNPYPPAPPMSSHPSQQGPGPSQLGAPQGQYPSRPTSATGYPGQSSHNQHQQRPVGQGGSGPLPHDGYLTGATISPATGSGYHQPPPPPPPNTQQPGQQQHQPPGQYDPYRFQA